MEIEKPQRQHVSKSAVQAILAVIVVLFLACIGLGIWQIISSVKKNSRADVVAIVETKRAKYTTIMPALRISVLPTILPKDAKRMSISNTPPVDVISNFISADEVDQVLKLADGRYTPSTTMSNDVNSRGKDRTSWSAFLTSKADSESEVLKTIRRRASALAQIPEEYIEPLQIVRYEKGEYYKQHFDYLDANSNEVKQFGQRTVTCLVYLNTLQEEDGGGTRFSVLDHTVQPVKGSALLWHNVTPQGNVDARTLHAGEPLTSDVKKYAINVWFRNKSQAGRRLL